MDRRSQQFSIRKADRRKLFFGQIRVLAKSLNGRVLLEDRGRKTLVRRSRLMMVTNPSKPENFLALVVCSENAWAARESNRNMRAIANMEPGWSNQHRGQSLLCLMLDPLPSVRTVFS